MRLWALAVGLAGGIAGLWEPPVADEAILIVGGDTLGYLSPCGCVKPMSGGLRRRATAVRALGAGRVAVLVENGGLVAGTGRQDELKAETLAETLGGLGVAAIHLTVREAALGVALLGSLHRLSGEALLSSCLEPVEGLEAKPWVARGPFLVGGLDPDAARSAALLGTRARGLDEAASALVSEAEGRGKAPVALFAGDAEGARALAQRHPALTAVVYRSPGSVPPVPEREGETLLLSPGTKGMAAVAAVWRDGAFVETRALALGPEVVDDPETVALYRTYLDRVGEEGLLAAMPRPNEGEYVGSPACFGCHPAESAVWSGTAHASALRTLEREGHGRDPDCVGCHVVALDAPSGFVSRAQTPAMADVGCESCHGPGRAHARDPDRVRMPRTTPDACRSCHVPDHSPGFEFEAYWAKIRHGGGENLGKKGYGKVCAPR